ncbi:MAG: HAMP domain-containing protein [Actinomycetia bacterium]|nr:HAMP domain-containing protein [Actinomycetes bacterium]
MKFSFQFKIFISFLIGILIAVATIAYWARYSTKSQFDKYLERSGEAETRIVEDLTSFYKSQGSWDGVTSLVSGIFSDYGVGIQLADENGNIIAQSGRMGMMGMGMSRSQPIPVDGKTVGTVFIGATGMPRHSMMERNFITDVNRSLYLAVIVAFIFSFILSYVISRKIVVPVRELSEAAEKLAHGEFSQRVNVRTNDELGELAETFNFMAKKLEDNERTRKNMLSDIAHELRTPITTLRGNLEGFMEGVIPPDKEKIAEIHEEVILLSRLVDDLRELSLAEAGELKLHLTLFNLEEIIEKAVKAFTQVSKDRKVKIKIKTKKPLSEVKGDVQRLGQALRNLLSNSLAHTAKGGKVEIRAEEVDGKIKIEIEDNGSGIKEEDLPYIFERFYRAEKSRSHKEARVGLGLAITKEIIIAHGGEIEAESEEGKGTLIRFYLPIEQIS